MGIDHMGRVQPAPDPDRQAFAAVFIEDVQHPERLAAIGPAMDKIIGPDMVAVFQSQPDAGSVIQPEPSLFRLLRWHFEPLPSLQPFDALVVHLPAVDGMRRPRNRAAMRRCGDAAIAVAAVLSCQIDHVRDQPFFVSPASWQCALGRTMLPKHPASPAFGNAQFATNMVDAGMVDAGPAARGAQKFPRAASVRISLSSVRSDTVRRRRSLSCCCRFSSFN